MDYASWTKRASRFLRGLTHLPGQIEISDGIEAPAKDKHTRKWLESTKCSIPLQLKDFVGKASRRCCFRYRWKPAGSFLVALRRIYPGLSELTGGADLCEAAGYQNYDNREWFANFMPGMFADAASGDEPERLRGRIELLEMRESGDRISLECKAGEPGGAIVYVPAGSLEGRVLSKSFDEFLEAWEKIAYVVPSWANLEPWLEPRAGLLRPDDAKALRLRQILAEASAPERSRR